MKYKIIKTESTFNRYDLYVYRGFFLRWWNIYSGLNLESVQKVLEEVKSGKRNFKGEIQIEAGEI